MKSFALNVNLHSRVKDNLWQMNRLQNNPCKAQMVFGTFFIYTFFIYKLDNYTITTWTT